MTVGGVEVGSPAGERSRVIQVRASRLLEEAVEGWRIGWGR